MVNCNFCVQMLQLSSCDSVPNHCNSANFVCSRLQNNCQFYDNCVDSHLRTTLTLSQSKLNVGKIGLIPSAFVIYFVLPPFSLKCTIYIVLNAFSVQNTKHDQLAATQPLNHSNWFEVSKSYISRWVESTCKIIFRIETFIEIYLPTNLTRLTVVVILSPSN